MQSILAVRLRGRCGGEGWTRMWVDGWRRETRAGQRSDAQQFSERLIFLVLCTPPPTPHTEWVIRATHLAHSPLSQAENEENWRRKRTLYNSLLLLWYPKAPQVFVDELLLSAFFSNFPSPFYCLSFVVFLLSIISTSLPLTFFS